MTGVWTLHQSSGPGLADDTLHFYIKQCYVSTTDKEAVTLESSLWEQTMLDSDNKPNPLR